MPASLLYEFDNANSVISNGGNGLEDRRAFELALELSLLGLGNDSNENVHSLFAQNAPGFGISPMPTIAGNPFEHDSRIGTKRSQNTTECVPVPSSEHVAEIVGRQGMLSFFIFFLSLDWRYVPAHQAYLFLARITVLLRFTSSTIMIFYVYCSVIDTQILFILGVHRSLLSLPL